MLVIIQNKTYKVPGTTEVLSKGWGQGTMATCLFLHTVGLGGALRSTAPVNWKVGHDDKKETRLQR